MKNDDFKLDEYRIKELLYNDFFDVDVNRLRKSHKIPLAGFGSSREAQLWYETLSEEDKKRYLESIELLLASYSLGFRWRFGIRQYVEIANEKMIRAQNNWGLTYSFMGNSDSPTNLRAVKIELDPQSTQEDLKSAYDAAQKLFRKAGMKKKSQYIENIDRDYEVYKKYKSKVPSEQILEWLNANYPGSFSDDNLKKIIKRAKARFGNRHPWSE